MPLSLLAASALADFDLGSHITLHCILDGNFAPFGYPHDWGLLLRRLPQLRSLMVVYIDIGLVHEKKSKGAQMPYGTLLRPIEEARVGERAAHSARFLGSYKEFRACCLELPRVVKPNVVLWADAPFYGRCDIDLARRVEALCMAAEHDVPIVITLESEVPEQGGPPGGPWLAETARQSMAILELGLGAEAVGGGWHWNRFVIPLDQTERGLLAAHAVLGVVRPRGSCASGATSASVRNALEDHGLKASAADRARGIGPPAQSDTEAMKAQWGVFCEQLRRQGRPIGPDAPEQERARQMMEFHQFCAAHAPQRR
mmetsp:Transcript_113410/g.315428  ORF Transcript_113410/g.315428 Transcript_113410/m.315428 type:complete len:314 (-) Transcript_113410:175-1116(-)